MSYFFIFVDILGYNELFKEIAAIKEISPDNIRSDFHRLIDQAMKKITHNKDDIEVFYGKDDYILFTTEYENIFQIIGELLLIETGYKDYEEIPFEIAIDIHKTESKPIKCEDGVILDQETIEIMQTYITKYYRDCYKEELQKSIKKTFIVLSKEVYDSFEPLDQSKCKNIVRKTEKGLMSFYQINPDVIIQRKKVFDFLRLLKLPQESKIYNRIDELFIPPNEYENIKSILKENQVIFLTGTAEYGKTYTAVRIMWEYYLKKGYIPVWKPGDEVNPRIEVRRSLKEIEAYLKPHRILYFEDPFGKYQYEESYDLERNIGSIIDSIKNRKDIHVIISSRDEVFQDFLALKISNIQLSNNIAKLNIKNVSYDDNKRIKMLKGWARVKGCKWYHERELKDFLVKNIRNKAILPTPLSIWQFTISTTNILEIENLETQLSEKSQSSVQAFARELRKMTNDKILFLCFVFIGWLTVDQVETVYNEMITELDMEDPLSFSQLLLRFIDDKIAIFNKQLSFSHPSFIQAFTHLLLDENGSPSRINKKIYCNILDRFSQNGEDAIITASELTFNFSVIPSSIRISLLSRIMDYDHLSEEIVIILLMYYSELPSEFQIQVPTFVERNNDTMTLAVFEILRNYTSLPKNVKSLIMSNIQNEKVAKIVALGLDHCDRWKTLPVPNLGQILIKLSEFEENIDKVIFFIVKCLETPSDDLLAILYNFKDPEVVFLVICAHVSKSISCDEDIIYNIVDSFPEDLLFPCLDGFIDDFTRFSIKKWDSFKWIRPPDAQSGVYSPLTSRIRAFTWFLVYFHKKGLSHQISPPKRLEVGENNFIQALDYVVTEFFCDLSKEHHDQIRKLIIDWSIPLKRELLKRLSERDIDQNRFDKLVLKTEEDFQNCLFSTNFIAHEDNLNSTHTSKDLVRIIPVPKTTLVKNLSNYTYYSEFFSLGGYLAKFVNQDIVLQLKENQFVEITIKDLKSKLLNGYKVIIPHEFYSKLIPDAKDKNFIKEWDRFSQIKISQIRSTEFLKPDEILLADSTGFGKLTYQKKLETEIINENFYNSDSSEIDVKLQFRTYYLFEKNPNTYFARIIK